MTEFLYFFYSGLTLYSSSGEEIALWKWTLLQNRCASCPRYMLPQYFCHESCINKTYDNGDIVSLKYYRLITYLMETFFKRNPFPLNETFNLFIFKIKMVTAEGDAIMHSASMGNVSRPEWILTKTHFLLIVTNSYHNVSRPIWILIKIIFSLIFITICYAKFKF